MGETTGQNTFTLQRLWLIATVLFGCLQVLLAMGKVTAAVLIITRVIHFPDGISYGISSIINLVAASIMLPSGVIWVTSCCRSDNRALNGVNLGFSILSFMFACLCVAMDSLLTMSLSNCSSPYTCRMKVEERKFCYTMLTFSVMLAVLSIGNISLSSKRCCCSRPRGEIQETTGLPVPSKIEQSV